MDNVPGMPALQRRWEQTMFKLNKIATILAHLRIAAGQLRSARDECEALFRESGSDPGQYLVDFDDILILIAREHDAYERAVEIVESELLSTMQEANSSP